MAVKASSSITLSSVVDVKAVYRYYLLQSSTLSTPSKPTTNPPPYEQTDAKNGWDDVEPTYTDGSTMSLYTVELNVFSDDTWAYSEVSLSSSYEAAKIAYNKAQNAQNTANSADSKADDANEKVAQAEAKIGIIENSLNMFVTDEEGTTLLEQTSEGWTFNLFNTNKTLEEAKGELEGLKNTVGNVEEGNNIQDMIDGLEKLIDDLNNRTAYIDMKEDDAGDPYLELGKRDDLEGFKVRITNSTITFSMGGITPIRLENREGVGYVIADKLIVEDEFKQGDYVWQTRSNGNLGLIWKGALG